MMSKIYILGHWDEEFNTAISMSRVRITMNHGDEEEVTR